MKSIVLIATIIFAVGCSENLDELPQVCLELDDLASEAKAQGANITANDSIDEEKFSVAWATMTDDQKRNVVNQCERSQEILKSAN